MSADSEARLDRIVRALRISGRRLLKLKSGWGVMSSADRRHRPRLVVEAEDVELLARDGTIRAIDEDAYVLADVSVASRPEMQPWAFIAQGVRRNARNAVGGFASLAVKARRGEGPLTMRHVQAGMRLITDAELRENSGGLTMNWDAGPVDRQRRSASAGGMKVGASAAAKRLRRARETMDERQWAIVQVLCIGGLSVRKICQQFTLGQGKATLAIAGAMEALAAAYEG